MTRFEIRKTTTEIPYDRRDEIEMGITFQDYDGDELVEAFDTKHEALETFKKYESIVEEISGEDGTYYLITEFFVTEDRYDDNGEYIASDEIWAFSKMPEF